MNDYPFLFSLGSDTTVFTDTLTKKRRYVAHTPRNHESLFFVTKGTGLYERGAYREIIQEGQVGYISRGSVDISSAYDDRDFSYIAINFAFSKDNLTPTLPFHFVCSQYSTYKYEELFQQALSHFTSKTPGYLTICNGLILQIIGYLYNEYKISTPYLQKMQKIKAAIDFLKRNYDNPDLLISQLAKEANMSEKHFRHLFLDIYKTTPYMYLQEFRINKAKILLTNTSKSISDIAVQCGFSDVYSFSHCFKKHTGVSPGNYKK